MDPVTGPPRSFAGNLALAVVGGGVIGLLTSFGQSALPFELSPLANSAGSWSFAAFLLALVELRPRRGALLGAVALGMMLLGYVVATQLRGFPVGMSLLMFWGAASIVVGPALGAGAVWVRGSDPTRAAAGIALIAGIVIGEGVYGLTVVAETTPAQYWVGAIIVGLGVASFVCVRRVRTLRHTAFGAFLTTIVAGLFWVASSGNLMALL